MKGSEALLRAIEQEGGVIDATRPQEWLGMMVQAGLLEKTQDEDSEAVFFYEISETGKAFLQKKGVR